MKKFYILCAFLFLSIVSYSQNYHPLIRTNTTYGFYLFEVLENGKALASGKIVIQK
jgi:hypothetical protein